MGEVGILGFKSHFSVGCFRCKNNKQPLNYSSRYKHLLISIAFDLRTYYMVRIESQIWKKLINLCAKII